MPNRTIRLNNIMIKNLKNVKNGTISFINKRKPYKASILGLYGQNGSGKTALIDALQLLKYVLCGQQIPGKYVDYINIDADFAELAFQFQMDMEEKKYDIWYQFNIRKNNDDTFVNLQENDDETVENKVEIFDEVLSYACVYGEEKKRKSALIDTRTEEVFCPRSKYCELTGNDDSLMTDLILTKRYVKFTSRSFIFSREMIKIFRQKCAVQEYLSVIEGLLLYGNRELFVINTDNSGWISLDELPLVFKYRGEKSEAVGNIMLPLDAPAAISVETADLVKKIISNMNIVLEQIVPDLKIDSMDLGSTILKNGNLGRSIQLISLKNGKAIPFRYESEGIKKIVSILQLLIVVYNNPSITVAIDEIDTGIFEYLLGEILNIISEKGKGQLLFTSHNLRPLETIDKGFIAFTTTNPDNRYIRMTNVKENNNLRDFYYRDIVLGEQDEQLYNSTNNYEIALAFREAGEVFGS